MFTRQNDYDGLISEAARKHSVPFALIKAVIAQESGFNPRAWRMEAAISDASRGLMQLLERTARGLGFKGDVGPSDPVVIRSGNFALLGLFDPRTNIMLGAQLLADLLDRTKGNIAGAVSAYNGGYRPELGFGERATRAVRLCLARDSAGRCISWRDVAPGEYGNQPHVDKVMQFYREYGGIDFSDVQSGSSSTAAPGATLPAKPDIPVVDLRGIQVELTGGIADFETQLDRTNSNLQAASDNAARIWYALIVLAAMGLLLYLAGKGS